MSLMRQFKPATEKPKGFVAELTDAQKKAAKAYRGPENHGDPAFAARKGAKPGPKPVDDPTVVMTFRLKKSVAARLKPGWRKRVAEFLEP